MSQATDAFNASSDPNKKLSDFVNPGSSPITASTPANPQPVNRDFNKEQAVIQKLNLNPSQLAMLDPKTLMERTYSKDDLAKMPDYQTIQKYQQTAAPSNATIGVLESALRSVSNPGDQKLGTSQVAAQAGLPTEGAGAFPALFQNLATRSDEMKRNYDNFTNNLVQTGRYQLSQYEPLAKRYKEINDQYQKGMDYIMKMDDAAKAHEYSMDQINQQFENSKKMEAYKTALAQGNVEGNQTGASVDTSNMQDTGDTKLADNCVLYARSQNPNLPYGLFTRADKQTAIKKFGVQNQGGTSMDGIKIGDTILTSESAKGSNSGHAATVTNIRTDAKGNRVLVLGEANFVAGKVTDGRTISATDPKIYGYVPNTGKKSNAQIQSPEEIQQMQQESIQKGGQPITGLDEGKSPGVFGSEDEAKGGGTGDSGYKQYGLLSNSSFKPDNESDKMAFTYITKFFQNSKEPTARDIGLYSTSKQKLTIGDVSTRARQIYYESTGSQFPDSARLVANKALITKNNQLKNQLVSQEATVRANVDLSLENIKKNGLNSKGFKPLDDLINTIGIAMQDPATNQLVSQNDTLRNELGSLLSIKNATGTTVYDKMLSSSIISSGDSEAVIKSKIDTMMKEAENFHSALDDVNSGLQSDVDPLELQKDNPIRQKKLGETAQTGMTTFIDSDGQSHTIPTENLAKAKQMDPGLKIQ